MFIRCNRCMVVLLAGLYIYLMYTISNMHCLNNIRSWMVLFSDVAIFERN